jgi:hypothetical protein
MAEMDRGASDFGRRTFVESGMIRRSFRVGGSDVDPCAPPAGIVVSKGRAHFWAVSSLKSFEGAKVDCWHERMCPLGLGVSVVVFERGSELQAIGKSAFYQTGLKSIVIPSSVVALGGSSFHECGFLESVIFEVGSRLERIERFAFDSSKLNSIVIPASVVVLGLASFQNCRLLDTVALENGSRLERIEEHAFGNSGLKSIVIPPRVASVGVSAFVHVYPDSISISPHNKNFRIHDWILEDFDGSAVYRYLGTCNSIVVPSSVRVLRAECFSWCESLEIVVFQSGSRLERIEKGAFKASGLKSIAIPSSVVVLGKQAFYRCGSLQSVIFETGSRLWWIGEEAFRWSGLTSIVLPPGVIFTEWDAFHDIEVTGRFCKFCQVA